MATIKCSNCGKDVSSMIRKCPYCEAEIDGGAETVGTATFREAANRLGRIGLLISLATFILTLGAVFFSVNLALLIQQYTSGDKEFLVIFWRFALVALSVEAIKFGVEWLCAGYKLKKEAEK